MLCAGRWRGGAGGTMDRGRTAACAGGERAGTPGTGSGAGTEPTLSVPAAPLMLYYTTSHWTLQSNRVPQSIKIKHTI